MKPQQATHGVHELCDTTRKMVAERRYEECKSCISEMMSYYPHSPIPHNLIGIVLEKEGCHTSAMKHFRAAYALDPTYLPARHNLEHYGTFFSRGKCAYDETDCNDAFNKATQSIENMENSEDSFTGGKRYEHF